MSEDYSKGSKLNPFSVPEFQARQYHEEVKRLNSISEDSRWYVSWKNWEYGPALRDMSAKEMWDLKDMIMNMKKEAE